MSFDADALLSAADTNTRVAMPADAIEPGGPTQPEGVAGAAFLSSGALSAAAELGLSKDETYAIARVCNAMVLAGDGDPERMDLEQVACSIGHFWGVLATIRYFKDNNGPNFVLEQLAEALAHVIEYDQPIGKTRRERARDALDLYSSEVGRPKVSRVVHQALLELTKK